MLSALTAIFPANLALTDSIQIFDGFSVSLGSLLVLVLIISVLSLIFSLAALRRAGRSRNNASQTAAMAPADSRKPVAAATVPAPGSEVADPALIAVLTAAVYMMLGEAVTAKPVHKSKSGFTIRKVRRV